MGDGCTQVVSQQAVARAGAEKRKIALYHLLQEAAKTGLYLFLLWGFAGLGYWPAKPLIPPSAGQPRDPKPTGTNCSLSRGL